MKRIIFTVVFLAASVAIGFSQQSADVMKKSYNIDFEDLRTFLDLSPFQWDEVNAINDFFMQMQQLSWKALPAQQNKEMQRAINGNLILMKRALTDEQYSKYISLLNVTNNNDRVIVFDTFPDTYLVEK